MLRSLRYSLSFLLVAGLLSAVAPQAVRAQYFSFGKNRIQYEAHDWKYIESEHFDVYFYEDGRPLAVYTARAAEAAYAQIRALLGQELTHRVPILIYQGHGPFSATNAVDLPPHAQGIAGVTELLKNRVVLPFAGDYGAFRETLHHELVHAVLNDVLYGGSLQSFLRSGRQRTVPLWFAEGLAEYAAQGWSAAADAYLREAVLHDALPPIRRLRGFMAYKGGQSVWDYVAEQYGREKIAEILRRLLQSDSVEESFRKATGLPLSELSERWHAALREIYYPAVAARTELGVIARPLAPQDEDAYHTSPALSPRGTRLAFITVHGGRFEVHLARTSDGSSTTRPLVEGQTNATFETLRPQTPSLTWSPDGVRLAIAVKSGPSDAIAVLNTRTGHVTRYRVPDIDQILSVAWSPDGRRLALSALRDTQSDLYVLDLTTHDVVNYTNDVFSDRAPAWSPGGGALVFHSDRGAHLAAATAQEPAVAGGSSDLYRLDLGTGRIERLTHTPWDETNVLFGPDTHRLLFLSDRNGIANLYAMDLPSGAVRPLTDLTGGILQVDISANGALAALVALRDGRPALYLLEAPFERDAGPAPLRPTVWAQRARTGAPGTAPSLAVAPPAQRRRNPFLRDAARPPAVRSTRALLAAYIAFGRNAVTLPSPSAAAPADASPGDDSTTYGGVRITFEGETPPGESAPEGSTASSHQIASPPPADGSLTPTVPSGKSFDAKEYKLLFSPDLIYGTAGYDALYGVQGLAQMLFSDMMGNHRIFASTNLLVDLRNADYLISYSYLPRRIDWSFSGYHTARLLPDYDLRRYFRYRRYGASVRASYPLDKFHRLDFDAGIVGVSQADIGDPAAPARARAFFNPAVTFTRDVSVPGFFAPRSGHRLALSLSGGVGPFYFLSVLGDARAYTSFGTEHYTLAVRLSGGVSVGSTRQLFFAAGVSNWLNRRFDPNNGLPIGSLSDFAFATPVLPLRGHALNARNGSQFGLLNVELRFPLRIAPLRDLLSLLPIYRLQGVVFADAGAVWGPDDRLTVLHENAAGQRVFDDLLAGVGGGVRTLLYGYPLRFDVAWPFDGRRFGSPRLYISVGFDF